MNAAFRSGEALFEKGEYREAIQEFQKVLEIDPDNLLVKDYIKKAEEKIRLEPQVLKQQTRKEGRWDRQEAKITDVKIKQEIIRQKQELRNQKSQARLEKLKAKKELRAKRLKAKQDRPKELSRLKAEKQAAKEARILIQEEKKNRAKAIEKELKKISREKSP